MNVTSTITETTALSHQSSTSATTSDTPLASPSTHTASDTTLEASSVSASTSQSTTESISKTPLTGDTPTTSGNFPGGTTVDQTTTVDHTTTVDKTSTMNPSEGNPAFPTQAPDQIPSPLPAAHVLDALIDGQPYHLPSPDEPPIEILLLDGTLAKLFANKVIMRGQTLNIPSGLSGAQEITSGGQTIKAQPGTSKQPGSGGGGGGGGGGSGGGGGGGGLGGLFKGLIGGASKAVGSLTSAGTGALDFASGAAGAGGALAGDLAGTFSTAAGDVGGIVSSINGIQEAFPKDVLSKAGVGAAMGALNLGRDSSNWLTSMGSMLKGFDGLTPEVQQQTRDNMKQYAGTDGPLQKAGEAMKVFEEFPWEEEIPPTQSPTVSGTETSNVQSSQGQSATSDSATTTQTPTQTTTTTSSSTPSPTQSPEEYVISSKEGTSREVFDNFIKELDNGVGKLYAWDLLGSYMYLTNLTAVQVKELPKKHDFLEYISRDDPVDQNVDGSLEEFRAIDTYPPPEHAHEDLAVNKSSHKLDVSNTAHVLRRALISDPDAPWWKKMISAPPVDVNQPNSHPDSYPPYAADDSGGRGTTIYILDDGFDLALPDLAANGRTVESVFAPNEYTLHGIPQSQRHLPGIGGGDHGTMMAVIAAGKLRGIAPNANLFLAKTKNKYRQSADPSRSSTAPVRPKALDFVLREVKQHISNRMAQDPLARSVINMSWGQRLTMGGDLLDPHLQPFFDWCEQNLIPVVISAGNQPAAASLDEGTPQHLGTDTNNIITVGAVKQDGTLWTDTAVPVAGSPGSMTIYAPGEDIQVPQFGGAIPGSLIGRSGTSQAAAITSGLAAYFFSLPNLAAFHLQNNPSDPGNPMKKLLVSHAWTRIPVPAGGIATPPLDPWPRLDELKVLYNLAAGDPFHGGFCIEARAERNSSACEVPTSTVSSSPTSTSDSISTQPPSTTSGLLPTTSLIPPPPATASPSPAPPSPTPDQCRINVIEFDNPDPNNHTSEVWSIAIMPLTPNNALTNNTKICFHGTDANEQTGVDVACPPIGEGDKSVINVRREIGDRLRFVWGNETWTAEDERCVTLENWHQSDIDEKERKRQTECVFGCRIDWSKPPEMHLD
ncbi:subtilisin-like protein [Lentithecium fluviatile CBS 122367]|uniref:Subtilisin-like protein n=1 Tax=Lentithecium fluviatile CBS 122367 TaxID=1168545 RepID=A0A6G1IF18_9PLEO|nr:subtilisin-like protein [Lentithecium fluviatile CBS 122367]